jgi:DNA-directed RNA polymerase sigma subunit (sigma70/sigma32)
MTLKQIAERLGISIPRVKQIETKALMRLKSILANNNDSLGVYDW